VDGRVLAGFAHGQAFVSATGVPEAEAFHIETPSPLGAEGGMAAIAAEDALRHLPEGP